MPLIPVQVTAWAPWLAVATLVALPSAASAIGSVQRPGTAIEYRLEQRAGTSQDFSSRFTLSQRAVLEKLNRADDAHLRRLQWLVVPAEWLEEIEYAPFPLVYAAASAVPKLLVVDQPSQAFGAYERGRLVRWGPVSTGQRASPTPSGLFHLNWRSRGRHSTVNPQWYMEWYFNFDNTEGLSLHSYALPGYPASHSCVRLLERDAIWVYEWGEGSTLGSEGQIVSQGTPLLVVGQYAFGSPPPWRSLTHLARGIDMPDALGSSATEHGVSLVQTARRARYASTAPTRRESSRLTGMPA